MELDNHTNNIYNYQCATSKDVTCLMDSQRPQESKEVRGLVYNSTQVAEIIGDEDQTRPSSRILKALSVMSQRTSAGQVSG